MSLENLAPKKVAFPSTDWFSLGRTVDPERAQVALEEFLRRYLPALKTYLRGIRKLGADDADDLLQGFVADKIIQGRLLAKADPSRGRFRVFLLSALDNYLVDCKRRQIRKSRSMVSDASNAEAKNIAAPSSQLPDRGFAMEWARQLLAEALRRMEAECRRQDRMDAWEVFVARDVQPMLNQQLSDSYETIVLTGRVKSPAEAYRAIQAGRRMFARMLRETVREYTVDERDVENELNDLKQILSSGPS